MYLASNPIFESYFQSDLFGKGIFLALLLLSIITWVMLLKKGLHLKQLAKEAERMAELVRTREESPLALDLVPRAHPFAETYRCVKRKSIEILQKNHAAAVRKEDKAYLFAADIDFLEAHLMAAISKEMQDLEKNTYVLSTIVTLAPFLGLLGTVWGILLTFAELNTNHFAEKSGLIMGGLSMALGTTIVGLVVAIPALIGYNYLKSSQAHFETALEDFGTLLLASVEVHYRKNHA